MIKMKGTYKCKWPKPRGGMCGFEFTHNFGRILNRKDEGNGGGCSAVKCPKCGNRLKPILDALTLKEIQEKKGGV